MIWATTAHFQNVDEGLMVEQNVDDSLFEALNAYWWNIEAAADRQSLSAYRKILYFVF
jgi:hypothetical protein